MASKGATVYVGARNDAKYQEAIEEIKKLDSSISPDQFRQFVADLGDLKAVERAATKVMESTNRLDILVNNAGL
jgi:NAD(P)-dependent dehydrogenase (short-subunit alcohol dehydrogenase family)